MILAPMMQILEGSHVSFLRQFTQKQSTQQRDGSWRQVTAEAVPQGAGTQSLWKYVERRQAKWQSGRPYGLFLTFVQERRVTREVGDSECRSGGKMQRRSAEGHGRSDKGSGKGAAEIVIRQAWRE